MSELDLEAIRRRWLGTGDPVPGVAQTQTYREVAALLDRIVALEARHAAALAIVCAVADSNPHGSWYPADSRPAGVVCRWCMERARSPKQCQHDQECTWRQARALVAGETREEAEE